MSMHRASHPSVDSDGFAISSTSETEKDAAMPQISKNKHTTFKIEEEGPVILNPKGKIHSSKELEKANRNNLTFE